MGNKLVIVESPAKARTIKKYLGADFQVAASMGHVRDLPKTGLAIDLEHDFAPVYEVTNQKVVTELRQAIKQADAIYLATDPDREGEAIAWHITEAIGIPRKKTVHRVVFHEITRNAVQSAINTPRQINNNLVEAQQARRLLDRLVGYQLSPLLWEKVKRGLSAGRVQSVAVRLIVEREQEIEAFQSVEYWTIEVDLLKQQPGGNGQAEAAQQRPASPTIHAVLIERDGKKLDKFAIENQEQADAIVNDLAGSTYSVHSVTSRDRRRKPAPPFTTSTLQQEAGRKLGFSAKKTMMLAQKLYEGINIGGKDGTTGLITYMRTDSTNVAQDAQQEARQLIEQRYGKEYLPDQPPTYKTKAKAAQEAHEAIRPTSSLRTPESLEQTLERDMFRLYELIWKRFVASQMAPAIFEATTVDIAALKGPAASGSNGTAPATIPYLFRATGSVIKFPGFLAVYIESLDEGEEDQNSEKRLPPLSEREMLDLLQLLPIQHFTEPPPRYTESSLVKEMEQLGIGRPSTYAPIISTIQDRGYVEMSEKKLIPTSLGRIVTELLVAHFANIVDYDFTSALEQQLDDVATGEKQWVPLLHAFYEPFKRTLQDAHQHMDSVKGKDIPAGITCPKCKTGELVIKFGRNGEFLACNRYNKQGGEDSCDFTSNFHRDSNGTIVLDEAGAPETSDVMCHLCGRPMVVKRGRFGTFLGCSGYPECKGVRRLDKHGKPVPLPEPTGVQCPKCQRGELLKRRGRFGRPFFSCERYPDCDYATNDLAEVANYVPEAAPSTDDAQKSQHSKNGQDVQDAQANKKGKNAKLPTKKASAKGSSKTSSKTSTTTRKKSGTTKTSKTTTKSSTRSSKKREAVSDDET